MTSSAERIQQLLADKATLTADRNRCQDFAEACFEYFQGYGPQCPICSWYSTPKGRAHSDNECPFERYAASRGDE